MYTVSVKNHKGEYVRYEVPEDVYLYIRQLEAYIGNPDVSRLKEVYKERFKGE